MRNNKNMNTKLNKDEHSIAVMYVNNARYRNYIKYPFSINVEFITCEYNGIYFIETIKPLYMNGSYQPNMSITSLSQRTLNLIFGISLIQNLSRTV